MGKLRIAHYAFALLEYVEREDVTAGSIGLKYRIGSDFTNYRRYRESYKLVARYLKSSIDELRERVRQKSEHNLRVIRTILGRTRYTNKEY